MDVGSSPSERPSAEVALAAEREGLGALRRTLTRHRARVFGTGPVEARFYAFDEGIVFQGTDEFIVFPWKGVSSVYLSSERNYSGGKYRYTLYSWSLVGANGSRLGLNGTFHDPALYRGGLTGRKRTTGDDMYKLFMLITDACALVSRLRMPDAAARLERGEELPFGELRIGRIGLRTGKEFVPWDSVKGVEVNNGVVRVKQTGAHLALSRQRVREIPNLPLFFTLVDLLRQDRR